MNKKADYFLGQESILYFYKMALIVLITVFIVIFVWAFFYREYDVRQVESEILALKVAKCYVNNGEASLSDFEKKPSEKCGISAGDDSYFDIVFISGFPQDKLNTVLEDGGRNQNDLRVLCDVFTNGKRPEGDYKEGCTRNVFHFVLTYEENGKTVRSGASILIKSGFKKRLE